MPAKLLRKQKGKNCRICGQKTRKCLIYCPGHTKDAKKWRKSENRYNKLPINKKWMPRTRLLFIKKSTHLTLAQIGQKLGISRQAVHQVYKRFHFKRKKLNSIYSQLSKGKKNEIKKLLFKHYSINKICLKLGYPIKTIKEAKSKFKQPLTPREIQANLRKHNKQKCCQCKKIKVLNRDFGLNKHFRTGFDVKCKKCNVESTKNYYYRNISNWKKNNICPVCHKSNLTGKYACNKCRKRNGEYNKISYYRRKERKFLTMAA